MNQIAECTDLPLSPQGRGSMDKPPSETPHGILETVFVTRHGGRPYKDGHYEMQCKVCHGKYPYHVADCEVASLTARVEEAERLCREVVASGVEFNDIRVRYLLVQVDRVTWEELAALAAEEGKQ